MKITITQDASRAGHGTADRRAHTGSRTGPRTGRGISVFLSAALTVACAALPAASDTSVPTGPGTGCWGPGSAPGLFDWSASPGIACRDGGAAAQPIATDPQGTVAHDGQPAPRTPGAPAKITISGSAHVGIAASF